MKDIENRLNLNLYDFRAYILLSFRCMNIYIECVIKPQSLVSTGFKSKMGFNQAGGLEVGLHILLSAA